MADFNIFGSAPEYLTGLLGQQGVEDLQKKALTTGLINTALGYLAQPKNQRLGGPLPYLARAAQAGMTGAQGVYEQGLKDWQIQQQIADAKRKQEQQASIKELVGGITDPRERLAAQIAPEQYVASTFKPKAARETTIAPNGQLIYKDTGELVTEQSFAAPKEQTEPSAVQEYNFARGQGYKGSFEDWKKSQKAEGVTVNYGAPVAGVDAQGNPVFFQPSKTGGAPTIVSGVTPPTAKLGEATQKQLSGIDSLKSAISSYRDQLKTWSPLDAADPVKRSAMSTVYNNMMLQAKEAYGLGVLNGPDYKILTDVVADPTSPKGIAYGSFGALDSQAKSLDDLMTNMKATIKSAQPGAKQPEADNSSAKQKSKTFNIDGKKVPATLGSDGKYYVTQGGKKYRVEED